MIGGVDTHADTIHVAAIDDLGRELDDREFPTTPDGYRDAITFLIRHGDSERDRDRRHQLLRCRHHPRRPRRPGSRSARSPAGPCLRRMRGKSDPIDAYQAATRCSAGRADAAPKDEQVDAIRALHIARNSAVKARTAAMNQIHHMLITAPAMIREKYRPLKEKPLVNALATCRPGTQQPTHRAVLYALKVLAQRHQFLTTQADDLEAQLRDLATAANPHLMSIRGVGPSTAAQLLGHRRRQPRPAADRGIVRGPVRHRTSPGILGQDQPPPTLTRRRQSREQRPAHHRPEPDDAAIHAPAPTSQRQRTIQRDTPEILRMLKRAIAREIFKSLTQGRPHPAHGPTPSPPGQEHHHRRRRQRPRHLAPAGSPAPSTAPTPTRPRPPLPRMARRRLTNHRSIIDGVAETWPVES